MSGFYDRQLRPVSVVFEKGENGSFFESMWNNAVGERMTIGYMWDEAQKKYVESESPDIAPLQHRGFLRGG